MDVKVALPKPDKLKGHESKTNNLANNPWENIIKHNTDQNKTSNKTIPVPPAKCIQRKMDASKDY